MAFDPGLPGWAGTRRNIQPILNKETEPTSTQTNTFTNSNPILIIRHPLSTSSIYSGMVICLERDADLHMAQLMPLLLTVSCFSKIQIGFTFLVQLTRVVPEKGPLNRCVCMQCCNTSIESVKFRFTVQPCRWYRHHPPALLDESAYQAALWSLQRPHHHLKISRHNSIQHKHTHTRLMALCLGLPGWASTRKVKPIWILLKQETVSDGGISWAVCKSAPCSRQTTMPAPHHSVFYRPDAVPAAQTTVSKHWRYSPV